MSTPAYPILDFFAFKHLPETLQNISKPFSDLAYLIVGDTPYSAETSAGLRKLLEAKDCIVRANLPSNTPKQHPLPHK